MKSPLLFLFLVLSFATLHAEDASVALSKVDVSFVPRFNFEGSAFERQFVDYCREEDSVVLSFVDVFRTNFAAEPYQIPLKQMRVFVEHPVRTHFEQAAELKDFGGFLLVPSRGVPDRHKLLNFAEQAREQGWPLAVGLPYRQSRKARSVIDISKHADVLHLYAPDVMKNPAKFRPYLERIIAWARDENPDIKVELGVPTARNLAGTQLIVVLIKENRDLFDQLAIYVDERESSQLSAWIIMAYLRGGDEQLVVHAGQCLQRLQVLEESGESDQALEE